MKNLMIGVLLVLVLAAPARTQAQTNVGTNRVEIAEFNALFGFKAEDGGRCRCLGYPGIGWYHKGNPVALTSMHHGRKLRWDGLKDGDCLFTDESKAKLADWFRAHLPKLAEDPRCKDWLEPKDKKKGRRKLSCVPERSSYSAGFDGYGHGPERHMGP